MRYCLACRKFSGNGPLCTQCGRSFGGRLCKSKKRHLNPPDAQFCGECGTDDLTDAASYLPVGCSGRLLIWGTVVAFAWWASVHSKFSLSGAIDALSRAFSSVTGYRSPLVWIIEKSASVLIILSVFYFLSMFMPGPAGQQFRSLLSNLCTQTLRFLFQITSKVFDGGIQMLLHLLKGSKVKR
jgi:hypothetical protein